MMVCPTRIKWQLLVLMFTMGFGACAARIAYDEEVEKPPPLLLRSPLPHFLT